MRFLSYMMQRASRLETIAIDWRNRSIEHQSTILIWKRNRIKSIPMVSAAPSESDVVNANVYTSVSYPLLSLSRSISLLFWVFLGSYTIDRVTNNSSSHEVKCRDCRYHQTCSHIVVVVAVAVTLTEHTGKKKGRKKGRKNEKGREAANASILIVTLSLFDILSPHNNAKKQSWRLITLLFEQFPFLSFCLSLLHF